MSSEIRSLDLIGLRVAELLLWLDARSSGVRMAPPGTHTRFLVPSCHDKFLVPGPPEDGLIVQVREGQLASLEGWRPIYPPSGIWELWADDWERYVFVAPEYSPPKRHVVLDPGFTAGEVICELAGQPAVVQEAYPLQDLDIVFFANWLASYGDLILHASGLDLGGEGYCFAGHSGAGKSTVATALALAASAVVLGEDSVILRYREGQFWIYGTPWHVEPDRCDPRGVPLRRLFFLDRTAEDGVVACDPLEGVARLMQTAFVPYYRPAAVSGILDRLALLSEQVPFYTLSYQLGDNVLGLIEDA